MNNQIVKINNTDLSVKEYKGQRVVTFKDIDMLHERVEGTARKRFNDNKKHFIQNEDYFVLNPDEAGKLFGTIAPNGLKLVTESGYLMLVKSLQDDLAWKVQRELVNNYFRVKNSAQMSFETMQGMALLSENMVTIGQSLQVLQSFTAGLKEYVQDSIQAKDRQIDDMAELVGLRSKNVSRLTGKLKEALFIKYRESIRASDIRYQNAKDKIFKEFKVYKWEDISVGKYNAVEAFIAEVITD